MAETNDVISHLYYDLNDKIDSLDQRLDAIDVEAATEPKVYVAFLAQAGVSAPTAVVHKNTLGAPIVYSYVSPGSYEGTLTGAFPFGKTIITHYYQNPAFVVSATDENTISIFSDDDDTINNATNWIKIEVYP